MSAKVARRAEDPAFHSEATVISSSARRRGVTLVETLVAMAVIAAIVTAVVSSRNAEAPWADERHRVVAEQLQSLRFAMAGMEVFGASRSFIHDVGIAPLRLSDLTNKISSTNGAPNSQRCTGQTYSTAQEANKWNGPYWNKQLGPNGLVLGRGFVAQDLLVVTRFDPVAYGNGTNLGGFLAIRMPGVELEDARALAELIDGNTTGTGGTVRFTASGASPVTVDYNVVVSNC